MLSALSRQSSPQEAHCGRDAGDGAARAGAATTAPGAARMSLCIQPSSVGPLLVAARTLSHGSPASRTSTVAPLRTFPISGALVAGPERRTPLLTFGADTTRVFPAAAGAAGVSLGIGVGSGVS